MNILVVGGAGYIGGALTDILKQTDGVEVTVYDSLLFEDHYLKDVRFVSGDIRDRKRLQPELDKADVVVWLAAIVGDGACALNPELSAEINQDAVKYLADNFSGRIIFPSTCSVYGAQDELLDENSPTKPLSVYAATKLAAEDHLKGKNAVIFRLGTLFGVSDNHSRLRMDLVVNILAARAYFEKKIKVFGGEQYRPLLHVKDAAKAMADSVRSEFTAIYNLSWDNVKILDIAKAVNDIYPTQIEIVQTKFEDSRNYRVKTDKAKSIGIDPQLDINYGLAELFHLFGTGRIKDFNNPRYSNVGYLELLHGTKSN